jgi:hypothetical protein
MTNTNKQIASILTWVLIVGIGIAQGQTLTGRSTDGSEHQVANLLGQARLQKRVAFSLIPSFSVTPMASGPNLTVLGGGTLGRLTKWTGFTSSNSFIGDSTMFEDKLGNVGIGTDGPTSKLTVNGLIQSLGGGFKFPDGTVQTSSAAGALFSVAHDATLTGNGTQASPLGVSSPLVVRDLDNPARQPIHKVVSCLPIVDGVCGAAVLTVPVGKRLVIEYATVLVDTFDPGRIAFFEITSTVAGEAATHEFPMLQPTVDIGGGIKLSTFGQQVRIYADPGSTVSGSVRLNMHSNGFFKFGISGHFVDVP